MVAFNVVKMRVKSGFEEAFLAMNSDPGHEVDYGLRKAHLIRTGDREYCFMGEWDSMDDLVAARPAMIRDLDRVRHMLEDLGGGLGVTDAVSGEVVATMKDRRLEFWSG